jgi:hypothetical protein
LKKQRKEIFKLYILKNEIPNLLVTNGKDKYTTQEKKFNHTSSLAKILNQVGATDELFDEKKVYTFRTKNTTIKK